MAGGATAGSGRAFRLDPFTLPVRFSAASDGGAHDLRARPRTRRLQAAAARRAGVTVAVPVSRLWRRRGPHGAARTDRRHPRHRRADASRPGAVRSPLIVADEPEDVAADWQAWGRALNLPLLVVAEDGTVRAPARPPRRPGRRRRQAPPPPFLLRRPPPALPDPPQARPHGRSGALAGREIIARD